VEQMGWTGAQPGRSGFQPTGQSDLLGELRCSAGSVQKAASVAGLGLPHSLPLAFHPVFVWTQIPSLSAAQEAIAGLWEVTGGLSAVHWLCLHHPVPASGSGPKSSLHQAWVRACCVRMSRR